MMAMLESVRRGLFSPLATRDRHFATSDHAVDVRGQFSHGVLLSLSEAAEIIGGLRAADEDFRKEFRDRMAWMDLLAHKTLDVAA